MRLLLAQQPDDERARPGRELLVQRGEQRARARDVVRAVEQQQRLTADDLQPTGRSQAGKRFGHDVG